MKWYIELIPFGLFALALIITWLLFKYHINKDKKSE